MFSKHPVFETFKRLYFANIMGTLLLSLLKTILDEHPTEMLQNRSINDAEVTFLC